MGTKSNPGPFDCYANAQPDEPLFVLLARDRIGASLVRLWAAVRETLGTERAKIADARARADAMAQWHRELHGHDGLEVLQWLPFDLLAAEMARRGFPLQRTIVAMPVERDENGFWYHPLWPALATPEETSEEPTARALGLELGWVRMEDQAYEAHVLRCENGEADCSAWTPRPPDDHPAWFLIAIFDTEDGAVAHWCRPLRERGPLTADALARAIEGVEQPLQIEPKQLTITWPLAAEGSDTAAVRITTIEQIRREAREAALHYSDINAACRYPFGTEAGQIFAQEFKAARASAAQERRE